MQCNDIRKFCSVRQVAGGGVKLWGDGQPHEYLGKICRWYMSKDETGVIVYAKSGKRVPSTTGAAPMMQLTTSIPANLDREWYINEAENMIKDLGI